MCPPEKMTWSARCLDFSQVGVDIAKASNDQSPRCLREIPPTRILNNNQPKILDLGLATVAESVRDPNPLNPTLLSSTIHLCVLTSSRVDDKYLLTIVMSPNVRQRSRRRRATPKRSPVGTGKTVATLLVGRGGILGSTPEPPLASPSHTVTQ